MNYGTAILDFMHADKLKLKALATSWPTTGDVRFNWNQYGGKYALRQKTRTRPELAFTALSPTKINEQGLRQCIET